MSINVIATIDLSRNIGVDPRDLPWEPIIEDIPYYMGLIGTDTVLLGHNTFKAMSEEPLGGRKNIVLTRTTTKHKKRKNLIYVSSVEEALAEVKGGDLWVLGGASIFSNFLVLADKVYLSVIESNFIGTKKLPNIPDSLYLAHKTKSIHSISSKQVWRREVYERCDNGDY